MSNKTIGILGGMGSWATLKFFEHILSLSKPDEFRIIIDNNVEIPSRSKAIKNGTVKSVHDGIWETFGNFIPYRPNSDLEPKNLTDNHVIVVPCNSAHYWYDKLTMNGLTDPFEIPWLNMIEIVSNVVTKRGFSSPLILGGQTTVEKKLYSKYLPGAKYPNEKKQSIINNIIQDIKHGDGFEITACGKLSRIVTDNRLHIDCAILACTELSLLSFLDSIQEVGRIYGKREIPIIDSSYEYAKATVEYARQ